MLIKVGIRVRLWVIRCCCQQGIFVWRKFFIIICLVMVLVKVEFCFVVSRVKLNRKLVRVLFINGLSRWQVFWIFIILVWLLLWKVVVVRIRIVVLISSVRDSELMVLSWEKWIVECLFVVLLLLIWVCIMDECRQRLCGIIVVLRMLIVRYSGFWLFRVFQDGCKLVVIFGQQGLISISLMKKYVLMVVISFSIMVFRWWKLVFCRVSMIRVLKVVRIILVVIEMFSSRWKVSVVLSILVRLVVMIDSFVSSYWLCVMLGWQCFWESCVRLWLVVMFRCEQRFCRSILEKFVSIIMNSSVQLKCEFVSMVVVQLLGFMQLIEISRLGLMNSVSLCSGEVLVGIVMLWLIVEGQNGVVVVVGREYFMR